MHCPIGVRAGVPSSCVHMLRITLRGFDSSDKAQVLWKDVVSVLSSVIFGWKIMLVSFGIKMWILRG